jgi:dihydroorotate dehydrogenase
MEGGGFSGPALFDRTLEMVKLFSEFDLPIMATGGISNIHHIDAAKENGASLFGMATALVLDPYCVPKINKRL